MHLAALIKSASKEAHLGFSYGYHDSAVAAIGAGGEILFAAHEERYSRIKHDNRFPVRALEECISCLGKFVDIKTISYYEKADLKEARKLDLIYQNYSTDPSLLNDILSRHVCNSIDNKDPYVERTIRNHIGNAAKLEML